MSTHAAESGEVLGRPARRPLLGASREQLAQSYADVLEPLTQDETTRSQSTSMDFDASLNLDLPPTEYGDQLTRVHPTFGDDDTIARFSVAIDFEPVPAARDEILARLEAKWGPPSPAHEHGTSILVFNDDPRVTVKEDTLYSKWEIEVAVAP